VQRFGHGATLLGNENVDASGRAGIIPFVGVYGPVATYDDVAVRDGVGFIASTPTLTVAAGNYLHCKIANPAESGVNLFVTNRRFTNTGNVVLRYLAYANPTATPATAGFMPNRTIGGGASLASFTYTENTNATFLGGTSGSSEAIPADGIVAERRVLVCVPPGNSLGFTVSGDGGPINGGNVTAVLEYYEEPVSPKWGQVAHLTGQE